MSLHIQGRCPWLFIFNPCGVSGQAVGCEFVRQWGSRLRRGVQDMPGSGMSPISQADPLSRTAGNAAPLLDTRTFADSKKRCVRHPRFEPRILKPETVHPDPGTRTPNPEPLSDFLTPTDCGSEWTQPQRAAWPCQASKSLKKLKKTLDKPQTHAYSSWIKVVESRKK
jgi:hypothetical protein